MKELLSSMQGAQCSMSIKLHFLKNHLKYFPENLGDISEEQGESFHQDIRVMERTLPGPMGLLYVGRLLLKPKEREYHRCAQTKIALKKIFNFMMIVTYLFYQMQCARDDVQ